MRSINRMKGRGILESTQQAEAALIAGQGLGIGKWWHLVEPARLIDVSDNLGFSQVRNGSQGALKPDSGLSSEGSAALAGCRPMAQKVAYVEDKGGDHVSHEG